MDRARVSFNSCIANGGFLAAATCDAMKELEKYVSAEIPCSTLLKEPCPALHTVTLSCSYV